MTRTELKLQAIVAARLKIDQAQVSLDHVLTEELGLDSFDLMDIILEIEQAFPPLSLADEAAKNLRTLREVALYIDGRRAGHPG
jgi:acyl carrier protein